MRVYPKFITFSLIIASFLSAAAQDDSGQGDYSGNRADMSNGNKSEDSRQSENPSNQIDTLRFRVWRLEKTLGEKTAVNFDTTSLDFQNVAFPERLNTIAAEHLSNLGSPFQSKIFADRTEKSPFIFMRSWEQWYKSPEEFDFINTTKPYTNVKYLTSLGQEKTQEENFQFYFTGNLNKYLNIGADYEIIYARGLYSTNATRDKLANFFGNYQSPRYEAFWKLSYNYMENFENGGITDDEYITEPLKMSGGLKEYESLNIPVNLTDAKNQLRNSQIFLNQKYHIGFERPIENDTLMEFVPVTSIIHTMYIDRSQKSYRSESVNLAYYDSIANIDPDYTADTTSLFLIRNTVGLSLREGFHDWVKMGMTGFVEHEYRKYTVMSPDAELRDSANAFSRLKYHTKSLLWAGGELYKHQGSVITYNALIKLCILGIDIGDFELSGNLNTNLSLWNHPVLISADGYIKNLQPDYLLEHYYSNHFKWDNAFYKIRSERINGKLEIPELGFAFSASVENINNYIYFNNNAVPEQYAGNIQVLSGNWKQHLGLGIFNWDNNVVYQFSSNQEVLPLPDFSVYSDLYLKTMISKVLTTHLGVNCFYHTSYYAPAYMPATGQFYTQNEIKIGDYPFMNIYANFHLKRMRFYVMYSHASRLFADPQYFSAPHYPLNPAMLKVGLSWNFWD